MTSSTPTLSDQSGHSAGTSADSPRAAPAAANAHASQEKLAEMRFLEATRGKKRVLASAFSGTTIEWYDFYLYGTAAALVFGHQYFPSHSEFASLVASFLTLAVGVVARPLGGILAGHWGDRIGRKSLLVVSLVTMGLASTLIGLLPTYQQIGWLAPAALVTLRIVQGLTAGAEWGGSALLSYEHAPANRRGFFGSFTQVGSSAGMLLATGVFFLVQLGTTDEQFQAWGWRIPFLASAVLVAVGLIIRLGVSDAEEFTELKEHDDVAKMPVLEVLTEYPKAVLVTAGLRLGQNGIYYLVTVYMLTYLVSHRGDSSAGVTAIMIASAVGLFSTPFWGWASDQWGRTTVSAIGYVGIAAFAWLLFVFLDTGALVFLPLVVIVGINLCHDTVYGPQAAWFAEQFPVHVRYSGVSLGYQLGTVVGGGIMPLIATLLLQLGGGRPWLICAHVTLLCVLSLVAAAVAGDPVRSAKRAQGR